MLSTLVSCSSFIESLETFDASQSHSTFFDRFSKDLPLFLREDFRFTFAYKKGKSPYSQKFFVQDIFAKLRSQLHPRLEKINSTKISQK